MPPKYFWISRCDWLYGELSRSRGVEAVGSPTVRWRSGAKIVVSLLRYSQESERADQSKALLALTFTPQAQLL